MKSLSVLLSMVFVLSVGLPAVAQDGDPIEFGPEDIHAVSKIGTDQQILVIYVQATDHRILAADLAALNVAEDQKVTDIMSWFDESSWGKTTFNIIKQRDAGDNWYVLPEGILDYVTPSGITSMEARDAAQASAANPTPPSALAANVVVPAGTDPTSDFDATEAGDYWYAVSGFTNGVESTLMRVAAAVTVAESEIVKLTITRPAADDIDRYIVYRTPRGWADALGNYRRIGYADVTGATDEYVDRGTSLSRLADHFKLLGAAMTAADGDVADYEDYNGVITIIFSSFLRGQSAGAVSFTVNGTSFQIQTINQSSATVFGRYGHEMGHWFGLGEQYDPVTFGPRGYWTTMDGSNDRQYATWEKDFRLGWIEHPPNIKELERPGPGLPDFDQTYKIVPTAVEEMAADTYTAIRIKSSESVNYYVEGRDAIAGNISDTAANNRVVTVEAVDAWPPGIYPKRTMNEQNVLAAGDPSHSPDPTIEITYIDNNAGPPESYNVNVKINAQERPDPRITPWGAPSWETIDIWVDSEREGGGWDDPATAVPKPSNGEAAWVDHVNRVYARITNIGPGNAAGVTVRFRVNTPGGVGDAGQFVDLATAPAVDIPAGESRNVFAEWTPTVGSHTCIKVEIEHIPGEEDIYNNYAQENVTHFYTGATSPWNPVTFPIRVANPFEETKRVDLEINGLQAGWTARFSNKWVSLAPKSLKTVDVTITPPEDARECTRVELDIYGMTQLDDYIQIYGGLNPIIHLANPVKFNRLRVTPYKPKKGSENKQGGGNYYRLNGVTEPVLKDVEIAVIVTDPQGDDEVLFANTNDDGEFESTFPANQPGTWSTYAYYAGDDCNAPTESPPVLVKVRPPGVDDMRKCCVIVIVLLIIIILLLITILRRHRIVKAN